ncbi:MAG: hypothetical protein WD942_07385 [Dehalococcoidia bacterium]
MTSPSWQLAGFANIADGILGVPTLTLGETLVPTVVEVTGAETPEVAGLVWSFHPQPGHPERPRRASSDGMLDAFVRLRTPADVLKFGRRYGVLGLCEHLKPATHNMAARSHIDAMLADWYWVSLSGGAPLMDEVSPDSYCRPVMLDGTPFHFEPVRTYLQLAEQARSLLDVAQAAQEGTEPRLDQFVMLGFREPSEEDLRNAVEASALVARRTGAVRGPRLAGRGAPKTVLGATARFTVAWKLREWASWAWISPTLAWKNDEPLRFGIEVNTWGSIVMQLMIAISSQHGLEVCSGCALPYMRVRRAQRGRRNYCGDCVATGVPQRDAARDYRARKANRSGGQEASRAKRKKVIDGD